MAASFRFLGLAAEVLDRAAESTHGGVNSL